MPETKCKTWTFVLYLARSTMVATVKSIIKLSRPLSLPRIVEENSRKFLGMFEMQSLENHYKFGRSIGLNKEGMTRVQYPKCA